MQRIGGSLWAGTVALAAIETCSNAQGRNAGVDAHKRRSRKRPFTEATKIKFKIHEGTL
jgi:hypothetical protein